MYSRIFGLVVALAGSVAITVAQQPIDRPQKTRTNDVPTPGSLGPARSAAGQRVQIDATGLQAPSESWAVDPNTGAEYRRGEVLVRFRATASATARQQAMVAGRGRRIARTLPNSWTLVELETSASVQSSLTTLRSRSEVAEVALNYRRRAHQVRPNDQFYDLQWNFPAIDLPLAWEINPGAKSDVTVAVIDSGLNTVTDTIVFNTQTLGQVPIRFAAVPDLVADGRIVSAFDFIFEDDTPVDLDGHGTHVAGTIGQQTNNSIGLAGVAYNAKLMPLKVLSSEWEDIFFPTNPGGSDALVADAIEYAADNGAKVINLSLGGPGTSPVLRDAIVYAIQKGAFVAISAGNSGDAGNEIDYPAAYAENLNGAMAVGAVNRDLQHAFYSTYHAYVEICAPGGEMSSLFDFDGITQVAYNDDVTLAFLSPAQKVAAIRQGVRPAFDTFEPRPFQGTSAAAPHVAGLAALLYSQGIRKPNAIEEAIKKFARPIQASAEECGAGLIDARRSVRGLGLAR